MRSSQKISGRKIVVALSSFVAIAGLLSGPVSAKPGDNGNGNGNSKKPTNPTDTFVCSTSSKAPKSGNASFIVKFKTSVTDAVIENTLRGKGASRRKFENARLGVVSFPGKGQAAARTELQALSSIIELCEDDQEIDVAPLSAVSASATQTPVTSWGLDRGDQRALPLNGSYSYTTDGAGVDVYVVDTGVLTTHNQFTGRTRSGFDATGANSTVDCNGHGTHVAGTVAGATFGIAPAATVIPVRVLSCDGSGTLSGVIAGIDWAIADHTTTPAVLNMSLGGGLSGLLDSAVQRAVEDGITVVVAAGNSGADACGFSPAAAPNAITVGSTTTSDTRSSFSNFGDCVDIFAPGSGITSAWHTSTSAAQTISGTSMAAPHVAGAAARLLSANPTFTPAQVATVLKTTATSNVVIDARSQSNLLLFADPGATTVAPPAGDGTDGGGDSVDATAPEAPDAPKAVAGDRSVRLQWTNNDDGGSAISGHSVRIFVGTRLIKEISSNSRTDVTVTGLKAGTSYTFRVAAINSIGRSPFSDLSNVAVPVRILRNKQPAARAESAPTSAPGVARNVRVRVNGKRLVASWRYAQKDVGVNTNFVVLVRNRDGLVARLSVSDWQGVTLTGLKPGSYSVRVRATNPVGSARASKSVSAKIR